MRLQELLLQHFRNYGKRRFEFPQNTTVFVGPNAIGKTNILEAIFMLAVGKSFRTSRDSEAVEKGEEVGRISAEITNDKFQISNQIQNSNNKSIQNQKSKIENPNDHTILEVVLTTGLVLGQKAPLKKYLVNGISRRSIDFVGNLRMVLFEPEDVELVRGSPGKKRNYLDFVLVQIDREYRRNLAAYEKGVRQRNRLLERIRDEGANSAQLHFWDQLLIKNGGYLSRAREEFIEFINAFEKPFVHQLADQGKPFLDFRVIYDHSYISEARLAQYRDAEIASATTLVGPHRDNFEVYEHERGLSSFGSRGEQRLGVLWLKLAELAYMEEKTRSRPLLLLDDIFSELDHGHREEVLNIIDQQQTIMTTTDRHFVPEEISDIEVVELSGVTSEK